MERIEQKLGAGLAAVGLVVLAMAWVSYDDARSFIAASGWVAHTHQVLAELEGVRACMSDLETGSRGFVISGQQRYLEPYKAALPSLQEHLDNLRTLTADNPLQQERLSLLEGQTAEKLDLIQQLLGVNRRQGFEAARTFLAAGQGKESMERARATIAQMEQEEEALLGHRQRDFVANRKKTILTFSGVILLQFVLLGLTYRGFMRDVKERRRDQEALQRQTDLLRESEEGFRLLLEGIKDYAIFRLDPHGNVVSWNAGAERIKGYKAEEIIGRHFSCFYPQEDVLAGNPERELHEAVVQERTEHEGWRVRKDGTRYWVNTILIALRDADGQLRGFSKVTRDITERKQAEEVLARQTYSLAQANAELGNANQELEAFTYSVSHDLRAPLRHIDGFSRILLEEAGPNLDAASRRYLERIREGTQQMGRLVDELLNLARIGRKELTRQVTGLNSVVESVLDEIRPDLRNRRIEFKVGQLPFVDCDATLMRQVFLNLLSNAVKYTRTREQAVIEVDRTPVNGTHAIFVRDNGVGFSLKYADKLFGVFQRLHRQEDFEGTGVGLATVQRIIHKHGGRVWAEAELDKGATFYFTLEAATHFRGGVAAAAIGAR